MFGKKSFTGTICIICAAILTGCLVDPEESGGGKPGNVFVCESDFQTGALSWIDSENETLKSGEVPVYSDAVIRNYDGYVYILERMGADNVIKYDPSAEEEERVLYQTHLGDNWNPQDIEFISATKAYIANMNEPEITVFNPATGNVIDAIDISEYTVNPDENSSPYANAIALYEDRLYVLLQRRDGFTPAEPTLILSVNTENDRIEEDENITCTFKNGYDIICVDGILYVTNPGSSAETGDGAIEKIDIATGKVTTILTEDDLGGSPNLIVYKEGDRFYIQNYIGWMDVSVVEIDAGEKKIVATLPDITDAFGGIAYDRENEKLYVGERDQESMGIKIFKNNKRIGKVFSATNSLPPSNITIIEE